MGRLKQNDYLYASGRIWALERTLLTPERAERMLNSSSASEAAKVLSECGYEDIPEITRINLEILLSNERSRVYSLLLSFVPHCEIIDVFRIKYDYHNLKAIIKAEAMDADSERLIINAGRFDRETLISAVQKGEFKNLPETMTVSIESAKDILSRTRDPQLSDIVLDKACFGEMLTLARQIRSSFLEGYVRLLIDAANIKMIVRSARSKKGSDFLERVLLEGGNIEAEKYADIGTDTGTTLKSLFIGEFLETAAVLADDIISGLRLGSEDDGTNSDEHENRRASAMTELEQNTDSVVADYLNGARQVIFGDAHVIAYLAAKENEYTTIRAILSGMLAGVKTDSIRQRLSLATFEA